MPPLTGLWLRLLPASINIKSRRDLKQFLTFLLSLWHALFFNHCTSVRGVLLSNEGRRSVDFVV